MSFYEDEKNIKQYIEMAEDYDGKYLIKILKKYLPKGSTILEIGMGPGKDLNLLNKDYKVTGSDYSQIFLDLYKKQNKNSNIELLKLDARTLKTNQKFDCIYSNKVLYHLTEEELLISLDRQWEILKQDGILFHSFWRGDKKEKSHGLDFIYYTEEKLRKMIDKKFEILEIDLYEEMEKDDSLYIILKKKEVK